MTQQDHRQDDIEAVAARWVARLDDRPLTPQEQQALDGWLAAGPANRRAFDYARQTWDELGLLDATPAQAAQRCAGGWRVQAAALAACLLVAVGLGVLWLGDPMAVLYADYRTVPAQSRIVTLPDGSVADLGPASAMALRFGPAERRVELLAGAVHVTAAPVTDAERRPFVVAAADGTAKALGTQFLVDRLDDAVAVTVTEHRVEVAYAPESGPVKSAILAAGERVHYGPEAGLGAIQDGVADRRAAWQRGRLVFDRVPLSEVVTVLNRYRHGRILVPDPSLAGRTVSGSFDTERLDGVLDAIARELGARTIALPPFATLLY